MTNQKEILIDRLQQAIEDELGDDVAAELEGSILRLVNEALNLYNNEYIEASEDEGLMEYYSDMDVFPSEE